MSKVHFSKHHFYRPLIKSMPFLAFGSVILALLFLLMATEVISRTDGTVGSFQKISDTEGGFSGYLGDGDQFGSGVANIGDVDGDGVTDVVVGAFADDDGGTDFGAVYILFLNTNGTVKDVQKISATVGGFTGPIDSADAFGVSVAALGDLDGDDVPDIAVGERGSDDGGSNRGAVYILFLNADGTVKDEQKISDTVGGFLGVLDNGDQFGNCVARVDDFNSDGLDDLVVCANSDDDGGNARGAVWILHLNTDGTVSDFDKISDLSGNFLATLDNSDAFGSSVSRIADLDGNGFDDIVVGAFSDSDGASFAGAVYILFVNSDGTVLSEAKVSGTTPNFTGLLDANDGFGTFVDGSTDFNADGISDLLVGVNSDDDGGDARGAYYTIYLNTDGSVQSYKKVSSTEGNFAGPLDNVDVFGSTGVASLGDLNGDGEPDVMVSARGDDDGGATRGAVWILFLRKISAARGGRNYIFPRSVDIMINEGASCTTSRDVSLQLEGYNANRVVIGHDESFTGERFDVFTAPRQERSWMLTEGAGMKRVYALFRSPTQELSGLQWADIEYDPINGCK
jgi:hypothetical protein